MTAPPQHRTARALHAPSLPAWPNGRNVVAWCPDDRRFHVHDREVEELREAPGWYLASGCRAASLGVYRLELQPGLPPYKDRRGWWRHDPKRDQLVRGGQPPRLPAVALPEALAAVAGPVASPKVLTDDWCTDGCGALQLRCSNCSATGCPCGGRCPDCGSRWPHTCEIPEYAAPCPACAAKRADAVTAWEAAPLDPTDDLALVADLPREVSRLRAVQVRTAAHPVFLVVDRIGGATRERFLEAAVDDGELDVDAAERFYADEVCRCPALDDGDPGQTFYRRHHEANRCPRCLVKDALEGARHDALTAEAGRLHRAAVGGAR